MSWLGIEPIISQSKVDPLPTKPLQQVLSLLYRATGSLKASSKIVDDIRFF